MIPKDISTFIRSTNKHLMQSHPRTRNRYFKPYNGRSIQTSGPKLDSILEELCMIFKVSIEDVMSDKRNGELVKVRRFYLYIASVLINVKQEIIATYINRERCAAPYHNQIVEGWLKVKDISFMKDWDLYTEKSQI